MSYYTPNEMANIAVKTGVKKATLPLLNVLFLGFLGGAFISLGYLFYIRVVAGLPHEWGTLSNLIGGAVFPLGLILVVVAGGELLTSTMMATSIAAFAKKITFKQLAVKLDFSYDFEFYWCYICSVLFWSFAWFNRNRYIS